MQRTLKELTELLNGQLLGDADVVISSIATLKNAEPNQISFLDNLKYRAQMINTRAGAVILKQAYSEECPVNAIVVDNPYLAYAKVAELFSSRKVPKAGIHPTAVIGDNCQIDDSVAIGPRVVIGDNVILKANVIIDAGSVIGDNCQIGQGTRLFANVTLYENIIIGERCCFHSGAVIGADGFGLANDRGRWHRVPQLGRVIIGNDVDVGANTAIDRGAIEDTRLDDGVKLDNLIQIGHNVQIGAHTAIAGCTGIAGSTKVGKHCLIGGAACITGHIEIGDQVFISGMTGVRNSIDAPGLYSSALSAMPEHQWRKNVVRLKKLDELSRRVKKLEQLELAEEE